MSINDYHHQLNQNDIEDDFHRDFVGGLWDDLGRWQLEIMKTYGGLRPDMKFLDLGCGCFRGGIHFLQFLESGNYYGIDVNASLVRAGLDIELPRYGLVNALPLRNINVTDTFDATSFGVNFDRVLAVSVWTHLTLNHIAFSLQQVAKVLKSGGRFYSTIFEVDKLSGFWEANQHPMGIVTYCYQDPYHYRISDIVNLIGHYELPFTLKRIGTCGHPRGQVVLELIRR